MAGCLISPVQEIGKYILTQCVWPPIKSHFDYWWCFDDNIQGLRAGIEELKRQKHYIEQKKEEARLSTDVLCPGVEEWLKASTEKLEEAQKILLPDDNIPKACNLISRYSLGKNAKKTAQEIAKLRNDGNFNTIADPAPPPATGSPFHRPTVDFESRKSIEKNIIDSLKKSSVDMIGICGMGGVGKTTMAQRIGKRVKEENLIDEVVMVTVSQTMDMPKIQNEIAELLGLKFDVESISARAHKLRTRLMDTKRKIIILDDVWESLRFEELGIPIECNFERCKVLLTSRSRDTCKRIKNKVVFDMKILEGDEPWILFKEMAGKCVEDSALRLVAKDVAKECNGLPIALVTVGIALQDETNIYKWKDSLSQLRRSNPKDFPEVLTNVYKPLKLSYDYLENDTERDLFLMCCLFPEDYDIPIYQLTWYSVGLRLFDDITNIEEARNRTHRLVEKLKSRYLLIYIDNWNGLFVKMHDVVRDVAIYIGSNENPGFLKSLDRTSIENPSDVNCNWMSVDISNEQMEVSVLSRFPKLRLLMFLSSSDDYYDISHMSFEGMEDLNVLSFQRISIPSLPPTLGSLKNLQTLCLFHCTVENISVIGKLTSLQILSCCRCDNIKELPAEIGRLKGLRLLEIDVCLKLQRIPFNIISSLFLLEELKIRGSFSKWETGEERGNASLTELERLRNLTCLEIEISDCTLSAQEIRLSQKLVRYRIWIPPKNYYDFGERYCEKEMYLNLSGAVGNWIQLLARNAESLSLRGDGSDNINLAEMENLRKLSFTNCSTVKKLVDTSYLNQNVSLCNLKSIYISECSNLKHLFSASVARTRLLQLEVLDIEYCDSMEQVFWNEGPDDNTDGCIEFPKLKELNLRYLPNLTAFCQGLENTIIKFPNLTEMSIQNLPKLSSLSPLNSETVVWHDDNTCFHFLCNPKDVSLSNLKSINIHGCDNLRSLFLVSAAGRCLLQLEVLNIKSCESMEQVFWNEGTDDNTDGCIEFPKLKELNLRFLPNLRAFCQGLENIIIKFPNLTQMLIEDLPKLSSLSPLNSETLVCHDDNTCFHFLCNPKVEMGSLNDLSLCYFENNIRKIWCHQIPNNVFNNLDTLDIRYMNGIRSLMSTSIAKNLVSLKRLNIGFCRDMVEVIEIDDDDKQVVDIKCLFPNLKSLDIRGMPKLRRFWQWNHPLELPLLEQMDIHNCTVMETFTLGSINTPNIRMINVNYKQIDDDKDLNDVIRHIWTESQDKSKAEEDGNEDEDECVEDSALHRVAKDVAEECKGLPDFSRLSLEADDQDVFPEIEDESSLDSELGKRLNQIIPVPHVHKINGEIPSADEATSDHQWLLNRLQLYDLAELKILGDGNCQFCSLSDQIYRTPDHHKFVREQVINQLKSQPELYENYVPMTYADYLKKMNKSGEWGDNITLQAAADRYGIKIFIITSFKDTCCIEILPQTQKSDRIIFLSFWAEVHYNSIYPLGELPVEEGKKKKWWT